MNIFKSFFAGLVIAAAAPVLDATVINFDDLNISDGDSRFQTAMLRPELDWTNFYVYDALNDPENLSQRIPV